MHARLKIVERFLTDSDKKAQYIMTCLRDSPFSHRQDDVKNFKCRLYEARWGAMANLLANLNHSN